MTELNPKYTAALQQIGAYLQALCDAIDSGDTQRILTTQQELTATAEVIWTHVQNDPISGREKAIARLLADAALKELPREIQDPANYPRIQRESRLLKRSLELWT